jgi:hypothetical protein
MSGDAFMSPGTTGIPYNSQLAQSKSQLQWHALLPSTGNQIEVRRYTPEDWDFHRQEITRLYERGTLEGVMKTMRDRHGLDAT